MCLTFRVPLHIVDLSGASDTASRVLACIGSMSRLDSPHPGISPVRSPRLGVRITSSDEPTSPDQAVAARGLAAVTHGAKPLGRSLLGSMPGGDTHSSAGKVGRQNLPGRMARPWGPPALGPASPDSDRWYRPGVQNPGGPPPVRRPVSPVEEIPLPCRQPRLTGDQASPGCPAARQARPPPSGACQVCGLAFSRQARVSSTRRTRNTESRRSLYPASRPAGSAHPVTAHERSRQSSRQQ